ncbi:MAG: hypothetical protein ACKVP4_13265 [Hyphomicrobium sp.]
MDFLLTLLSPLIWLIQVLLSILLWIVWQLLWIVLWFILPLAIVAYVAFRLAEKTLGPVVVRAWLKRQSLRLGGGIWDKLSRGLIASSVLPFRVIAWFLVYSVWHSIVGLLWTPRWKPWPRAWAKRWKAPSTKTAVAR